MKKILCIAETCCDMIFGGMPRLPGLGEEIYGSSFAIRTGGGANTPLNLGRLGAEVSFLTGLGADDMGGRILKELRESGVAVDGALGKPGSRTAVSAVLSTKDDRGFASYGGTGGPFFTLEQLEAGIRGADIVHTYLGYCTVYPIAQLCEKYHKQLSLDASWSGEPCSREEMDVLHSCSWLKVNELEAARLAGIDAPETALKKLADLVKQGVVITLGARGSMGMAGRESGSPKGKIYRQDPIQLGDFRDACGAGDSYAAGMLWGISRGMDLAASMERGAVLSGLCVTWLGGNSEMLNCTMMDNYYWKN